ncbi:hypothetical protein J2T57_002617 [Natronocella acetinitrilica]|uniref:Uncharacterized protein n=1 Tax=Natronocella acetinitrilica TaxID=414046 RepID=A0AAE3G4Z1_9GAMM|nr:hypothetical protein [Natronocella acetinitrilica]MCP1675467.1 hypothetical protein [Natronocella acetinitrilica]
MPVTLQRILASMALVVVLLALAGCAALNTVAERLDRDSLGLQLLASQSSARFVDAGSDQAVRAAETIGAIERLRDYVDAADTLTMDELIAEADRQIPWHRLSPADEQLIRDLYLLFREDIERARAAGELSDDAVANVHALLDSFARGARPYLR